MKGNCRYRSGSPHRPSSSRRNTIVTIVDLALPLVYTYTTIRQGKRPHVADSDSISQVFIGLRAKLAKAVSGLVPPKEIEDIVQETYVRVRQTDNLERIRRPESFLYRTARNLALDHIKRAESQLVDSTEDLDQLEQRFEAGGEDSTLRAVVSDDEFAKFCEAVRFLPEQCRRAFVLRKVYGFSQREIAEVMSIAESTVEKHIALGVKRTLLRMKAVRRSSGLGDSPLDLSAERRRDGRR